MKYEIINDERGSMLQRTDDDGKVWIIPMAEGNSDYQAYLASLQAPQANSTES
jgi:hypothetical protein